MLLRFPHGKGDWNGRITNQGGIGAMTRLTRVSAAVSLVVALLVVVGCGDGGGGAPQSNTPPNTLIVALEAEPPELDPNLSSAYVDRQVMASIYDKLVDINQEGEIVPVLAESYEVSDDDLVYTFNLRQGVEFHDGTPFDAEAVVFNFERISDPEFEFGFREGTTGFTYPIFP